MVFCPVTFWPLAIAWQSATEGELYTTDATGEAVGGLVVGGIVGGLVLGGAVGVTTGTELKFPSEEPPSDIPGRIDDEEVTSFDPPDVVTAMMIMITISPIPTGRKNLGLR